MWAEGLDLLRAGGLFAWLFAIFLSLFVTLLLSAIVKILSSRVIRLAESTEGLWDDFLAQCFSNTKSWFIFSWVFYLPAKMLSHFEKSYHFIHAAVIIISLFQVAIWSFSGVKHWRISYLNKKITEDASSAAAIGLLYRTVQGVLLITFVLIGLSNLGIDVGALVAGLGVGGIAIALAAQNVLGDLLASLSIVLDKPFVVGDSVSVGGDQGTVEHIGIKTTRVRSLTGEELILSNKDMLESRIRNYKRMKERRAVLTVGVVYSTTSEKMEKIPFWIKATIEKHSQLRFDRCHFSNMGSFSLDFEIVYWVLSPDYNIYMDLKEKLLLEIYQKFNEEKVAFAYPTQTILLENNGSAPTMPS